MNQVTLSHFLSNDVEKYIRDNECYAYDYLSELTYILGKKIYSQYLTIRRRDQRIDRLLNICKKYGLSRHSNTRADSRKTIWNKSSQLQSFIKYQNDTVNALNDIGLRVFEKHLRSDKSYKRSAMAILQSDFALQNYELMSELDHDQNVGIMRAITYAMHDVSQRNLQLFRMTV